MRVLVAGGTGLIGSRLIARLRERGDQPVLLTRRPGVAREQFGSECAIVEGNPMDVGPWMDSVHDCDGVINLVGESIFARRWNEEFINLLRDSRVKSTTNIAQAFIRSTPFPGRKPKPFVNASAIGIYGARGGEEITEDSSWGNDTLAVVGAAWEKAAEVASVPGVRVALVRIGVVLDRNGGALKQMLTPFKLGLGGPIGSGKQWMSWIHYEDVVGILILALDNEAAKGPINGTAPEPATNKDFTRELGRALHRPTILPVPTFALKLKFGQVAEVLTTGQRVLPKKALDLGYHFRFPDINSALADLFSE